MPHISCVLCRRRIGKDQKKKRIGAPALWSPARRYGQSKGVTLERTDPICHSCYLKFYNKNQNSIKTACIRNTNLAKYFEPAPPKDPNLDSVSSAGMSGYLSTQSSMTFESISTVNWSMFESNAPRNSQLDSVLSDFPFDSIREFGDNSIQIQQLENSPFNNELSSGDIGGSTFASSQPQSQSKSKGMEIEGLRSVKTTQSACCLCGEKTGRSRIPKIAITQVWVSKRIIIPFSNRCCRTHIEDKLFTDEALELVNPRTENATMTAEDVCNWMKILGDALMQRQLPVDFSRPGVTEKEFKVLLGVTRDNFQMLLPYLNADMRNSSNRTKANALALFLMKMRLNVSQTVLAVLFGIRNQSCISETIEAVIKALGTHFVPKYLGFEHVSREEVMESKSVHSFNTLLSHPNSMILICDGTYWFIQKPSDFELQRLTYSQHKHRNLVKSMMVITTNGYIADSCGLYGANGDCNDSNIFRHMLEQPSPSIGTFMQPGDVAVVDRGFRDVISHIKQLGFHCESPNLLPKKAKQFTTLEANESRLVTLARFLVEVANGEVKNMFPYLASVIPVLNLDKGKLNSIVRICCAIVNAFKPPLFTESTYHQLLVESALNRLHEPNKLQEKLESTGLIKKRAVWFEASADSVPDFPKLTENDLKQLTLGVYQLRMAKLYALQHMKNDTTSTFKLYIHKEEDNLIRAKIQSRFSKSTRHNVWIEYFPSEGGAESITGWYCTCKTGARTLGCCSHVTCMVWYLSHGRYLDKLPRKRNLGSGLINCILTLARDEESGGEDEEEGE